MHGKPTSIRSDTGANARAQRDSAPHTTGCGGPIYHTMQVAEGAGRRFGVVAGAHVWPRKDRQDTFSHGFGPLGRSLLRKHCAREAPDSAGSASVAASSLPSCFFDRGTTPRRTAGRQRGAARHYVAIHRRVAPTSSCGVRVDYYPIVRPDPRTAFSPCGEKMYEGHT